MTRGSMDIVVVVTALTLCCALLVGCGATVTTPLPDLDTNADRKVLSAPEQKQAIDNMMAKQRSVEAETAKGATAR